MEYHPYAANGSAPIETRLITLRSSGCKYSKDPDFDNNHKVNLTIDIWNTNIGNESLDFPRERRSYWDPNATLYIKKVLVETGDTILIRVPTESINSALTATFYNPSHAQFFNGSISVHYVDVLNTPCNHVEYFYYIDTERAFLHQTAFDIELYGDVTQPRPFTLTGRCLCHTKAGDLRIEAGEKVLMQMATPRIVDTVADAEEIYRAIGVTDYQPTLPVQIAYSGLPDIMIPLRDVAMLQSLKPDMEAITAITRKYETVSLHVFAFAGDSYTAHVRDFAPLYDIPEESATGTANAALTHYLQQNGCIPSTGDFSFLQGEAMGRPSVVSTRITANGTVYVGGAAAVVAERMMVKS